MLVEEALGKLCPPSGSFDLFWLPSCVGDQLLDSFLGFREINVALESKNEGSACGMDGIDYGVLKALPISFKLILLDLFNEMYDKGVTDQLHL